MEKIIGEITEHGPIDIANAISSQAVSKAAKKELLKKIGIISVVIIIGGIVVYLITRPDKNEATADNYGPVQQAIS